MLFRGNAEARIRENLLKQGYIKGIIGLPANLFYGTGIPACIIVIDKEHAHSRKSIFMIDASKGFMKDGNKNRLRSQDIHKIVDVFNHQRELPRFSCMVSLSEIADNDYNLNIPRYIDSSEPEDLHDLSAHLQGGIPNRDIDALQHYWQVFPSIRATLFSDAREGYSQALIAANKIKSTILEHQEFKDFAARSLLPFKSWIAQVALQEIRKGDNPKQLIDETSEVLLEKYANTDLLDKYNVYQILMDYWTDTMQDDIYVLIQDGWCAGKVLRELITKKGEKLKEAPDLVINKIKYKAELIPPELIVTHYFQQQQDHINQLQADMDTATQELESFIEEHSSDDGLLNDALYDKDKVTKASVAARLKVTDDQEEKAVLKQAKSLFEQEADAKKALKEAQDKLDIAVVKRYPTLTDDEIKMLVVQDKWLSTLQDNIKAEIEHIIQQLANRVKELEERYVEPLPELTQSVETLSSKVAKHLKTMGLTW